LRCAMRFAQLSKVSSALYRSLKAALRSQ
jgi:hypothetical protein